MEKESELINLKIADIYFDRMVLHIKEPRERRIELFH